MKEEMLQSLKRTDPTSPLCLVDYRLRRKNRILYPNVLALLNTLTILIRLTVEVAASVLILQADGTADVETVAPPIFDRIGNIILTGIMKKIEVVSISIVRMTTGTNGLILATGMSWTHITSVRNDIVPSGRRRPRFARYHLKRQ